MESSQKILSLIQDSIDKFDASIPAVQRQMFDELVKRLRELDTRGGAILSSVKNLRLIGDIKNSLEMIIITKTYTNNVAEYLDAFQEVSRLQNSYFKDFNNDFKPAKTLPVIRELAIDATINSLTEGGLAAGVLNPIESLLQINATTGGQISDLYEMLRNRLISSPDNIGGLQKYTQQITTDALNQFSANYHKAVTADLGFEWYRYSGLTKTTSREFCIWLRKKDFFHVSEIPELLKGRIDGHQCAIYKKTGLPYGFYEGTNESNLITVRGGYNCGDQAFGLPTAAVPVARRKMIAEVA